MSPPERSPRRGPGRSRWDRSRSPHARGDRDSRQTRHDDRGRSSYSERRSPPRDEYGRSRPSADPHHQRQGYHSNDRTHERRGHPPRFESDGRGRRGPPDAEVLAARRAQRNEKAFSIWPASPTASADEEDRVEEERVIAQLQGKLDGAGDSADSLSDASSAASVSGSDSERDSRGHSSRKKRASSSRHGSRSGRRRSHSRHRSSR
ncbi:hypothetical protein IWQ57_003809, partial [Coemansia nantahalensis]